MKSRVVQDTNDGVVLTIHVQPNASRTDYAGLHGDALKIRVAAPPLDGTANTQLTRFLSERFRISHSSVEIQAGGSARRKRVLLRGLSAEQVESVFSMNVGEKIERR